jgi:hypothetical protein
LVKGEGRGPLVGHDLHGLCSRYGWSGIGGYDIDPLGQRR